MILPVLLLALWFGMVTGFGEVIQLGFRRYIQDAFIFTGADVIWTAPLATGLFFVILFLPVAIGALFFPRLITRARAAGLCIFLGAFSWFYLYPEFHRVAALILAAGLGIQAARMLAPREQRLVALVRRTLPVLLIASVLLGAGLHVGRALIERRAIGRLPEAKPGAPNVLLIVLDTVRGFNMSLYGYPRQTTPEIDAFAAGGFRFDRAISTAPWTLPSHASMFTGRQVHELDADWLVPLGDRYPVIAEALGAQGYVTAGFVANTNYTSSETGLARGFIHYVDYTLSPGLIARNSALFRVLARNRTLRRLLGDQDALGRRTADEINKAFLSWLKDSEHRPFFAFLNYYDAHRPYLPPEPWASKFVPEGTRPDPRLARRAQPGDHKRVEKTQWAENAYDGAVAYLDNRVGRMLEQLESRGILDNTLVIITSDHGEEFGEHGLFDHGNSLYRQAVQVPLVLVGPMVPEGSASLTVSLSDIPATIIELTGMDVRHSFPGSTLSRFWSGDSTAGLVRSEVRKTIRQPEWYPASEGNLSSAFMERYRLIRNLDTGEEELYDVFEDPRETTNLMGTEAAQQVLPALRASVTVDFSSEHSGLVASDD